VKFGRLPGVELMRQGTWNLSSGEFKCTPELIQAAVDALSCPAVRRPILKAGHDSDMPNDGEPCIGYVDNLRVADGGSTLVGDYAGLPGWLVDRDDSGNSVMASAYPDRSIEGSYDHQCQLGHTHPFVVHAVALLGVTRPGIGDLKSLQDLYGIAAAAPVTDHAVTFAVRAAADPPPDPVIPAVADSPKAETAPVVPESPQPEGDQSMAFHDDLRSQLGLAADASESDIAAAVTSVVKAAKKASDDAAAATAKAAADVAAAAARTKLPEGTVAIDSAQLEELKVSAAAGVAARAQQESERREGLVMAAVREGKIPPARKDAWIKQLEVDAGAAEVLASLAPGLIPVSALGHSGHEPQNTNTTADDAVMAALGLKG
jgi:hypothetical protein